MVTAGPTVEKIDPVRFISNFSTGKMGYAIAEALASEGAKVLLVSGPVRLTVSHPLVSRIDVTSADEMFEICQSLFPTCDGAVMTAAVADYSPVHIAEEKLKRVGNNWTLELKANRDIAAELGKMKRTDQMLIGFALETQNELDNAQLKMERKNLDMIVLNSLREEGAGFGHDTNKVTLLERKGHISEYALKSKREVASDIVEKIAELLSLPA
ncbi:MAG: phosphopantothenoylcysteine decarboxylase [Marinilabiliales bacterium]|nr:phosphopantothenoylcysteine decarboxylase [Marinilabiliales bacterium]